MEYSKGILSYKDNIFMLDGVKILDCSNPFNNFSRVPLFDAEKGNRTISELVMSLKDIHAELNAGTEYERYSSLFMIISTIAADKCMRCGEHLKACEIGCNNGALSQDIATLLYAFDPEAKYTCVSNVIGNESGMEWLDRISCVTSPSGLSLLASDFADTGLKDDFFDITIINGQIPFDDPIGVIKEGGRITNKNGILICYSEDQYLLDDGFKMYFSKRNEWRFDATHVLFKSDRKNMWVDGL